MAKICRIEGCNKPVRGMHSTMCDRHERQKHRNGAVGQRRILKKEIEEQVKIATDTRDRNPTSPLWEGLRDRWRAELADAYRGVERVQRGLPEPRYVSECNEWIVKNGDGVGQERKDIDGFAALHDALKRSNFAQHAKNTSELSEALEKVGFMQRRTKAGRFWRFPSTATSGAVEATAEATAAVIEATAETPELTRRVMSADEADAWRAAGKPGLVTGSRKPSGEINPKMTVTPVTGEID